MASLLSARDCDWSSVLLRSSIAWREALTPAPSPTPPPLRRERGFRRLTTGEAQNSPGSSKLPSPSGRGAGGGGYLTTAAFRERNACARQTLASNHSTAPAMKPTTIHHR